MFSKVVRVLLFSFLLAIGIFFAIISSLFHPHRAQVTWAWSTSLFLEHFHYLPCPVPCTCHSIYSFFTHNWLVKLPPNILRRNRVFKELKHKRENEREISFILSFIIASFWWSMKMYMQPYYCFAVSDQVTFLILGIKYIPKILKTIIVNLRSSWRNGATF